MSARPFVIFDIDGTISNYDHRRDLAHAREWDDFHARCVDDPVIVHVADLLRLVSTVAHVVLQTGRNERFRAQTHQWLKAAGLDRFVTTLLMRGDDDYRKSEVLKLEQLIEFFGDADTMRASIWFIAEDNDRNSEAFRNAGLTVLQSAPDGH